ncbi:hypothetical protein EZJ55_08325 [Microcystis aeruginosa EAWAG127a]|uniref:Uncharacterized protein n=1 Tax=Microcystis aeruginosa EAWAG127a TaxID=2529855 RepID=A0A5J5LT74_MICAE|nr:hypothetical protein EZJ55_08325 [Microcystis aeruginosa EAWAG127a]
MPFFTRKFILHDYLVAIDLCVLCVSVVRSTCSLGRLYLRIHFTHQTGESQITAINFFIMFD